MSIQAKSALAGKLRDVLDGPYADIRRQTRDFIARPDLAPVQPGTSKDVHREATLSSIHKMIDAGFSRLPYPEEYGGKGAIEQYLNFVEILAHQDMSLSIKQGVQFGLFGMGLYSLGTQKHHEKYIPDIMQGKLLGGFGMTEVGRGSNVQGLRTEAVYDHATRSFILNTPSEDARKTYIGNAAKHGRMMIVFAQLKMNKDEESKGVHAFLVPVRDEAGNTLPGVTIGDCGHKIGLNGVDNGTLYFENVSVPYSEMLDRFASIDESGNYKSDIEKPTARFFKMIATLVMGRISISMSSLSGAKNALTSAISWSDKREVFGNNLLDAQASQTRMFSHLADVYALHFATRQLVKRSREGSREVETLAAGLKARASDDSIAAIDECRKITGGAGYMSEERFGAFRNDVDIFRTFEGDNLVLRMLVAKNQLSDLGAAFKKASMAEKIKSVVSMKIGGLAAKFNAAVIGFSEKNLLNTDVQSSLFARREREMLYAMVSKGKNLSAKLGKDGAANGLQDDMIAYADAYTEKITLDAFIKAVNEQTDPDTKAALKDLCNLYAVNTLRKNGLWYVESGFMSASSTKQLSGIAHRLGEKIRPNAIAMVDAFAIPESVLYCRSPASVPA